MKTGDRVSKLCGLLAAVLVVLPLSAAVAEAPPIQLVVNGRPLQMDVAPVVVDGRVMVPARFLAEALGAKVEWDPAGQRVIVTSKPLEPVAQPTPPQRRQVETKAAKVGDLLKFTNLDVTVAAVRYGKTMADLGAAEGRQLGIITLSITTRQVSVTPLQHAVGLVAYWELRSGASIEGSSFTKDPEELWPGQSSTVEIAVQIPENETLAAVRIRNPYDEDIWTQYVVDVRDASR